MQEDKTPPEPVSASTPQPAAPAAVAPSADAKKKKKMMLIGIIVAAVLVAGGAAYGVYAYVTNTPDYLLSHAGTQFAEDSKTAVAAKFKITSGTDSVGVSFSGDIAARADSANNKNGEAVIGIGSGSSRVTVTARVIDDTSYLRFGSLSNVPTLMKTFIKPDAASIYDTPEFAAALARINDKWFSLTKQDLQDMAAQTTGTTGAVADSITPQDIQKVVDIYNKHKIFKADKPYNDEDVDNVKSAHFSIAIDKAELTAYLTDIKNANINSIKVTDEEIANVSKDVDDFAKNGTLEVWITRDSKKLKQLKFASTQKGSEFTMTLTFLTDLPQFDKLEKPATSQPFSELMTTLLGPSPASLYQGTDPSSSGYYYPAQ